MIFVGAAFRDLIGSSERPAIAPGALFQNRQGASLTPKEYEVIELLGERMTTGEIRRQLFIADVTVRTHIANIVHKLNAADREDLRRLISKASETPYLEATE